MEGEKLIKRDIMTVEIPKDIENKYINFVEGLVVM